MELTVRESEQISTDTVSVERYTGEAVPTMSDQEEEESYTSGEAVKETELPVETSENQQPVDNLPIPSRIHKKKKKHGKKKKETVIITDDDFGPVTDFTKNEGFVYDPSKAEFDINEVRFEKRPWEIPDVRSVLYLRRLERKHNKLVHGLASVRKLTPKQILKEESGSC